MEPTIQLVVLLSGTPSRNVNALLYERVENFKYLGSLLGSQNSINKEIKCINQYYIILYPLFFFLKC